MDFCNRQRLLIVKRQTGKKWFSIHVNNLPAASEVCSTACYVDDTKIKLIISFTVNKSHAAEENINADLQRIRDWCFENYLLLNLDKTKLMVFGSLQMICKLPSFKLCLLGKELLPKESVKVGLRSDIWSYSVFWLSYHSSHCFVYPCLGLLR